MTTAIEQQSGERTSRGAAGESTCVTVVIPVYNESALIESVIEDVVASLEKMFVSYSVLVINDGSTDWSDELERDLCAKGPVEVRSFYPNAGKGAAVNRSFALLDSEFAVVIDADGEYLADDIAQVLEPLIADRADWVIGSRYGFGRPRPHQYLATYWVNRLINWWLFALSGLLLQDVLSGLYAFRTSVVSDLKLREARFSYTAELMCKLLNKGAIRWCEVPIEYRFRSYAEGKKIQWWETGTILWAMLRYRFSRQAG